MNKAYRFLLLGIALSMPLVSMAADEEEDEEGWSGKFSAGYLSSEGNTNSDSATAEFELKYVKSRWEHLATGRFFSSRGEVDDPSNPGATIDDVTAENYNLAWKSLYNFNEFNYAFGKANWIKNRFSSFPRQIFATAGYGRRLLNNDSVKLDAEVGAGYADQKAIVSEDPLVREDQDGAVATGSLDFKWIWTETSEFGQILRANYTSDNTFWESITKVSAKINASLALGISYTVQGNTDVAPTKEKTDRFTAITLDYSF